MFQNLFDKHSRTYAQFRPRYPKELYDFVASHLSRRRLAWDCGTGNGQAACALADYFERVIATDSSSAQLEHAQPHERVEYRLAPAEKSGLMDESVDLIAAANAVHWFDLDAFYSEAKRVLRDEGVIAVWCYSGLSCDDAAVDAGIRDLGVLMKPYWANPIQVVHDKYRSLTFPFADIDAPQFTLDIEWNIAQLLGYISTWSACENYKKAQNEDPIEVWLRTHAELVADQDRTFTVHFPLHMRIGRYLR